MNEEFFEAVKLMEKERGVPAEYLYEKIQNAIVVAVRRMYNGKDVVFCDINPEKSEMRVFLKKVVVEIAEDNDSEISLEEAKKKKLKARVKIGDMVEIPLDTKEFGRIAAQTAKHVIRQGIRDAERGQIMKEFQKHNQEIVTAKVQNIDKRTGNANLEIGKAEALLLKSEQIPGEIIKEGDLIKVYIMDVSETEKGPRIMISRVSPVFVRSLFEMEVPEIEDGTVEIKSVAREAGSRTKIAVFSKDENVDAVGACIGPRGTRVSTIVETLCGEKIDIVEYSENPEEFIAAALAPSDVVGVEILSAEDKSCKVIVPDTQLSLAIGNKGQNVRLAARLTGWKIDINPESGFFETEDSK